jgi:hypothetical protein
MTETGWAVDIQGVHMTSEDITAGEWEALYLFVNRGGLPHAETDIRPLHCPSCRNAIPLIALMLRGKFGMAAAAELVGDLTGEQLLDLYTFPTPEPEQERDEPALT